MAFDISKDNLMGIDEICQKLDITKRTFRRMRSKENIAYLDTKNRAFPEPVCYLVGGKSPKCSGLHLKTLRTAFNAI